MSRPARPGFVRTLRAETFTGLLVLVVMGLLTGLGPAKSALEARQIEALTLRQSADPLQATLTIRPPRPGPAKYEITLVGPEGTPYTIARRVRLRFTPPDPKLGMSTATAEHQGEGHYTTEGAFVSLPGAWQVELQVQRPDGYDAFTRFTLTVATAIRAAAPPTPEILSLADGLGWGLVVGGVALALFACRLRLQREHVATAPLVLGIGLVLILTGRFQQMALSAPTAVTSNPIAPTQDSIARGQELYTTNCQVCHGASGRGDGPAAATLNPPPLDLNVHAPLHSDPDIFALITNGIPGTAMPAHEKILPPDDRWHIINYVRALTSPQ
jgi:mono/diheme cytochrome c family protein